MQNSVQTQAAEVPGGPAVLGRPLPAGAERSGAQRSGPDRMRRGTLVRRRLIVADVVGLATAFLVAELLFGHPSAADRLTQTQEYLLFLATIPGWIIVAKLYRLYDNDDERTDHSTVDDLTGVFHLATVGAWLAFVTAWASGASTPGMAKLVGFWALAVVFVTGARAAARASAKRKAEYLQNTIVVGAGDIGQLVARKLVQHREYGIRLLGLVDARPMPIRADLGDLDVIGRPDELPRLVRELNIERVVFAFSDDSPEHLIPVMRELRKLNVQVDIVPRYFDLIGPHVRVHSVEGLPVLALPAAKRFPASETLKRMTDVVVSAVTLVLLAPLFLGFAWLIRRDSDGPVFFRQTRLGKDMREFTVLKFRTMRTDVDQDVHRDYIRQTMSATAVPTANGLYKLDRSDAITPFGGFLRKTSLDELPQLINVLRGEMSLVGPRPCLKYETEGFAPHHFERFEVPQGITGLWQVTARAHATFGEALDMDVQYARNWSLGLDLWLLLKTPIHVLQRRGTA
jgi:exopolysaccharide biosynthesis polyprenyl glycosylphosphotransferase